MNGARTTFMRRGYLFTALSALLLLAASAGTAQAQVTVTGPAKVTEGGTATYTVSVKGYAPVGDTEGTITVQLAAPTGAAGNNATIGELGDIATNLTGAFPLSYTVTVPANPAPTGGTGTPMPFSRTGSIVVPTTHDRDAEDENFELSFTAPNVGGLVDSAATDGTATTITLADGDWPTALTIEDNEEQKYTLTLADGATAIEGGTDTERSTFAVELTAVPEHVQDSLEAALHLDAPNGYSWASGDADANGDRVTVGDGSGGGNTQTITITTPINDEDRDVDSITLTAYAGPAGRTSAVVSESFDVADIHVLPTADDITAMVVDKDGKEVKDASITEGGEAVDLQITVDRGEGAATTDEMLTVEVVAASAAQVTDFRLSPTDAEFVTTTTDDEQPGSPRLKLSALADEDVGEEMLVLSLVLTGQEGNGGGMSTGTFSIPIKDATDPKIQSKSESDASPSITGPRDEAAGDDGLNPGESFMVTMSDLFEVDPGYSATYDASSEGSAVSISERGDVLTIEAVEAGMSTVTVTGTATMDGSSFAPVPQTVSDRASVTFDVEVKNTALVVTVAADPMEIDEGGMSTITATANRAVVAGDGDVTVDLTATDGGMLSDDSITIAMGEMSGSVTLTATEDDGDYEDGTVTVVASGSGIDGQVSIAVSVMDNDEAPEEPEPTNAIEAKPEGEAYPIITGAIEAGSGGEGFNPGESAMVDASELFTVMDGYNATYAASVDGDAASASVSGSHVTVMADMLGEAKVTITGTATAAGSSFQAGQPDTNVATVTFAVMVVDKKLTIELHGPENVMEGNLVEGQSYRLTVQANRVVREDTMVSFGRDRAMSDAEEGTDYELNDVTILAGSDSVSATLDVLEDGADDAGHGMGEQLVIYAMAGDAESNSLTFTIWDHAVPALPLIAQMLLALFLMAGGARLYRRRQG